MIASRALRRDGSGLRLHAPRLAGFADGRADHALPPAGLSGFGHAPYPSSFAIGTPSAFARRRSTGSEGFFLSPVSSWATYPGVTRALLANALCVIPLDSLSV